MNNFTALRIFGALLVMVRHSVIILDDRISPVGPVGPDDVPPMGLWIFFVTAGYLLPGSWRRRPRFVRYVSARVLRVFPGLIVALLVTVLVIGLIATTETPGVYLRDPDTLEYFMENLVLHPHYSLPGVFPSNPYAVVVNGALWSLAPLFALYLVVPLVGSLPGRWTRATVWCALLAGSILAPAVPWIDTSAVIWGSFTDDILRVSAFFCAGALIRESQVVRSARASVILCAILAVALVVVPSTGGLLAFVIVPYLIVVVGSAKTPVLRSVGRFGDPSYGMFLLGFPVQQLAIWAFPDLDWFPSILLTVVVSVAFGYALWWTIDVPLRAIARPAAGVSTVRAPGLPGESGGRLPGSSEDGTQWDPRARRSVLPPSPPSPRRGSTAALYSTDE